MRLEEGETIQFFADWGFSWPLWCSEGTVYPDELGLSQELADRLERWVMHWQRHHESYQGWDSEEDQEWSDNEGDTLVSLLKQEAPQFRFKDDHRR
ncbi:hypothetical protein JS278_01565 [Acidipropionibacterium virtanenii]|uniref:Uncharacterized protein n=1 Tax=Acidipropionibacterium virtanenii TaxID=2057246 RepID=A0A344UTY1_9ACTN|nr:hypothetical protein JS278_01565 [Acidipropionibacterium virtanenii]